MGYLKKGVFFKGTLGPNPGAAECVALPLVTPSRWLPFVCSYYRRSRRTCSGSYQPDSLDRIRASVWRGCVKMDAKVAFQVLDRRGNGSVGSPWSRNSHGRAFSRIICGRGLLDASADNLRSRVRCPARV